MSNDIGPDRSDLGSLYPSPPFTGKGLSHRYNAIDLQRYVGRNHAPLLHKWEAWKLNRAKRQAFVDKYLHWLKPEVRTKVSRLTKSRFLRVNDSVEAIKDALILASPDRVPYFRYSSFYWKLLRWAWSLEVHSPGAVTKQWKLFCQAVKWRCLNSSTPEPEGPKDFPGWRRDWSKTIPPQWRKLLPWLNEAWQGVPDKRVGTYIVHLCSSRGFPEAENQKKLESMTTLLEVLYATPEETEVRERLLYLLSEQIGYYVRSRLPEGWSSNAHLSLANAASFSTSMKEGGRTHEVRREFVAWATEVQTETVKVPGYFGRPYHTIEGYPRWMTMCREECLPYPLDTEYGESDYLAPISDPFDEEALFTYQDPLFGLDEVTGYQLLQWSLESGIKTGALEGARFPCERGSTLLRRGSGYHPSIRIAAIGEPGFKARTVTVGESWLTLFMQPFSHEINGLLTHHPFATAGLSRGWQGFQWVKGARNKPLPPESDRSILTSDLTTATDYCNHRYSRALLKGFLSGLDIRNVYFDTCVDLLTSPRTYVRDGSTENLTRYERMSPSLKKKVNSFNEVSRLHSGKPTKRGILMGDPGAKAVLTLTNLAAELEAIISYLTKKEKTRKLVKFLNTRPALHLPGWRHVAVAGDDHIAFGPERYLKRITLNHHKNGMKVCWSDNFVSKIGGFYCEEMICISQTQYLDWWGDQETDLLNPLHYEKHPHVDAMKVRIMSPRTKDREGRDEANPAFGRSRMAHGMISWLSHDFQNVRDVISARWEERLNGFLPPERYHRYLPTEWGGMGIPSFHRSEEDLTSIFREAPDILLKSICEYHQFSSQDPILCRILKGYSIMSSTRGLDTDPIEQNIRDVLSSPYCRPMKITELRESTSYSEEEWKLLTFAKKAQALRATGLIPVSEAIKLIDRVYMFRNMLTPDISRRHNIDPDVKPFPMTSWSARSRRLQRNLEERYERWVHLEFLWNSTRREETIRRIVDHVVNSRTISPIEEALFVPRDVVITPTLCTLSTKLNPFRRN